MTRIIIYGRPSGLEGSNRGDMLSQISATQVESIEIITNPSAKYEAEGSSGIINIIMKKDENRGMGYNGTLGLNMGTGDKYSGQLNFSLRNNKYYIYGNYGYNSRRMIFTGFNERFNYINSDSYFTDESSNARGHMRGHNAKFGMDIFLNPANTLGFSFNLRGTKRSRFDLTDDIVYNNANI